MAVCAEVRRECWRLTDAPPSALRPAFEPKNQVGSEEKEMHLQKLALSEAQSARGFCHQFTVGTFLCGLYQVQDHEVNAM